MHSTVLSKFFALPCAGGVGLPAEPADEDLSLPTRLEAICGVAGAAAGSMVFTTRFAPLPPEPGLAMGIVQTSWVSSYAISAALGCWAIRNHQLCRRMGPAVFGPLLFVLCQFGGTAVGAATFRLAPRPTDDVASGAAAMYTGNLVGVVIGTPFLGAAIWQILRGRRQR